MRPRALISAMTAAIVGLFRGAPTKKTVTLASPPNHRPRPAKAKAKSERRRRLRNWSWRMRQEANARFAQRYGLDIEGDDAAVADARRRLRNARKQERRAAR